MLASAAARQVQNPGRDDMNKQNPHRGETPGFQQGATTLVITLILLFAATIVLLTVGRVVVLEQTISGNEQRAVKALTAADAGLQYSMNWLRRNFVDADSTYLVDGSTATWGTIRIDNSRATGILLGVPGNITPGGDSYSVIVTITPAGSDITPNTAVASPYLYLRSTATDSNDPNVGATVSQYMAKAPTRTIGTNGGPPLITGGCIDKATGTPDIHPLAPDNVAILANGSALTTPGYEGLCSSTNAGHFLTHGGIADNTLSSTVWNRLFPDLQVAELIALSDYEASLVDSGLMDSSDRTYYWVTSSEPWQTSLGSGSTSSGAPVPDHMVVLGFSSAANCPPLNGGTTIWGAVYVQGGCPGNGQGWGGSTVYGTVGIDGMLNKFNANATIYEVDYTSAGGPSGDNPFTTSLVSVAGTWVDF